MTNSLKWNDLLQNNYGAPQIELVKGEGSLVFDAEGKRYIDMLGGIATNVIGHAHPKVVQAVSHQVQQLGHVSNFFSHPEVLRLAQSLQRITGDETARIFFCNSGTEANEAALKLSRTTGRKRIVSTIGSFHGRSMGALSMTGQESKRAPFAPLIKSIKFLPYGDIDSICRAITSRTAMVIVEPIQGENGVVVPQTGYLAAIRERTLRTGTIFAIDAVQTGMGRTGEWFGYETEGVMPDLITLAKGIGAGLPLGAMIAFGKFASALTPGSHGSTFGGNPIACAAGSAAIEVIESEGLLEAAKLKGEYLVREISSLPGVVQVRGKGLLLGIVLQTQNAAEIKTKLERLGVIVNAPNSQVIRLAPALNIPQHLLAEFVSILKGAPVLS